MDPKTGELIVVQIEKSKEKLNAAKVLLKEGFIDDTISRAIKSCTVFGGNVIKHPVLLLFVVFSVMVNNNYTASSNFCNYIPKSTFCQSIRASRGNRRS